MLAGVVPGFAPAAGVAPVADEVALAGGGVGANEVFCRGGAGVLAAPAAGGTAEPVVPAAGAAGGGAGSSGSGEPSQLTASFANTGPSSPWLSV
jgi:hypothetical protein